MLQHQAFCKTFTEAKKIRQIVLGSSQLILNLCESLELPVEVIATSLYYLHRFLETCNPDRIEMPLLCGSCILLSWKYLEDLESIRCSRKCTEICCEIFRLLVISNQNITQPLPLTHKKSRPCSLGKEMNLTTCLSEKGCCSMLKRSSNQKTFHQKYSSSFCSPENAFPTKVQSNVGTNDFKLKNSCECVNFLNPKKLTKKPLTDQVSQLDGVKKDAKLQSIGLSTNDSKIMDWMMRDNGLEFNRVKERIKNYEACLLRCLHFEIGPVELPFQTIQIATRYLWTEEICVQYKENSVRRAVNYNLDESTECFDILLSLSYRFALDFYRSPYCLLYKAQDIGAASVWKATVGLGFRSPFRYSFLGLLSNKPLPKCYAEEIERERRLRNQLFSDFQPVSTMLLRHFRLLLDFLLEFRTLTWSTNNAPHTVAEK